MANSSYTFNRPKIEVSDLANGTDGQIITWDAAGTPTTVGPGTSGQALISNGAGAAPSFQTLPSGASDAKAWAVLTISGGTPTLANNFNIASIADRGAGMYTINFDTDFANTNYTFAGNSYASSTYDGVSNVTTGPAVGSLQFDTWRPTTGNAEDVDQVSMVCFGDQ